MMHDETWVRCVEAQITEPPTHSRVVVLSVGRAPTCLFSMEVNVSVQMRMELIQSTEGWMIPIVTLQTTSGACPILSIVVVRGTRPFTRSMMWRTCITLVRLQQILAQPKTLVRKTASKLGMGSTRVLCAESLHSWPSWGLGCALQQEPEWP